MSTAPQPPSLLVRAGPIPPDEDEDLEPTLPDDDDDLETAPTRPLRLDRLRPVREASEALHNTPAVARASYIAPRILETFEKGITVDHAVGSVDALASRTGLDVTEKSLLGLLETPPRES